MYLEPHLLKNFIWESYLKTLILHSPELATTEALREQLVRMSGMSSDDHMSGTELENAPQLR